MDNSGFFSIVFMVSGDAPMVFFIPFIFGFICYKLGSLVLSLSLLLLGAIMILLSYDTNPANIDIAVLIFWPVAFWILVTGITVSIILCLQRWRAGW